MNQRGDFKEFQWVITKQLQELALETLFHKDKGSFGVPERGFLGIVYAGHGVIRQSLLLRKIISQESGWIDETSDGLSFSSRYFSRALDILSSNPPGGGLVIVHSHFGSLGPITFPPEPSKPDLYHERRLLFQLSRTLPSSCPVAAGILVRNGAWRIREYHWPRPKTVEEASSKRFGIDNASFADATGMRVVSNERVEVSPYGKKHSISGKTRALDSTLQLWGTPGHDILDNLRVGIAGLGGVGSILTEFLARLGIGELVLVDFDIVNEENLNRLVGARRDELGKPKTKYAERIAKVAATSPKFAVYGVRESVVEWDGLRHLLDCDIILNAADSPFARQVLDHVSYAYCVPVIDGGTILLVDSNNGVIGKSQVGKSGPGDPCLECCGSYDQQEATMARESPRMQGQDSYVQPADRTSGDQAPRAPSVISFNSLVASLMIQRMFSCILGFPPTGRTGQQRYYVEQGLLDWAAVERCREGCPKQSWIALGNSHPVPVGIDPIWKQMRELASLQKGRKHN
jgi:ThiF family protein